VVLYRFVNDDDAAKHVEDAEHGVDKRYGTWKGGRACAVFNKKCFSLYYVFETLSRWRTSSAAALLLCCDLNV